MFLFWKNIGKYQQLKIFLSTSWNKVLNAEVRFQDKGYPQKLTGGN